MQKRKRLKKVFFITLLSCLLFNFTNVSAASVLLKIGSQGKSVVKLQKDLRTLGYLDSESTGYYGTITSSAVKKLQKKYGLKQDGVTGSATLSLMDMLVGRAADKLNAKTANTLTKSVVTKTAAKPTVSTVSRGSMERYGYMIPWFGGVEDIWSRGVTAKVLDVETGLSFKVMRTYGTNHADCETLTPEDTAIMKEIYGGQWSWNRRAIIVTVGEYKIAASLAGMPHAGIDNQKGNVNVSGRSGGYGYGVNLDTIKGNNMDGHFDIHFLGSRTHTTNIVEKAHQNAVKRAAAWAEDNL